jgi:hypothetical protein
MVSFHIESLNNREDAMKMRAASVLLAGLVLTACGGGDGGGGGGDGGGGPNPPGNLVTGSVMKGPFTAGTITGLEFTTNGATLGTAQIQSDGSFELDVGSHTGPLLLRVDGGTYMDEVTGVQAQTEPMFGMVPTVGTGATANVTPLTGIFAQLVFGRVEGPPFDPFNVALNTITTQLENWLGITNILTTTPADLAGGPVAVVDAAAEYGAILAGMSQQAFDLGVAADALAEAITIDAADGALDGMRPTGNVVISGGGNLPADAMQAGLATAINTFLGSAANNSGLTAGDFTALTTRLANRPDTFLFVMSIDVNPKNQTLAQAMTVQYTAQGTFSDGSSADITSTAVWNSSDTNVATISATGFVTAGATPGPTTISAEQDGTIGSTTLNVTGATLVSIAVTPANPSIFVNATQQFTATGTFSDMSTTNLTGSVDWDSGTPTVLDLTAGGFGTGLMMGTSVVTATDPSSMIFGDTTVTVMVPVLVSIAVTPASPTLFVNDTQQFTATGTYSDSSTADITASVDWDSGTPAVLDLTAGGLGTGLSGGTSVVTATDVATNVMGTTTVTVAELVSIAVTPNNSDTYIGQTRQFTAMGTYSNAAVIDITSSVTWMTSDALLMSISTVGVGTGVAAGTVQITATQGTVMHQVTANVFISYANNIQPIFNANCTGCHPPERGLNLTTYNGLMAGATQGSGAVIVPSNAANSILWQRIEGIVTPRMPFGGQPLPQAQRDRIRDWINAGALNN